MNKSEAIGKLALALSKAQAEMGGAMRNSKNPFFKSEYADLESVWSACREPLSKNELAVIQTTEHGERGVTIVTTLAHSSGEWIESRLNVKPVKDDPQALGSALSYGRRYALAAIVGIYQTDDDAETAMSRASAKSAAKPVAKVSPAQAKSLATLIAKAKASVDQFLDYFGIEELEDLPASNLDRAQKMLDKKIKDNAALEKKLEDSKTEAEQPAVA
jgi:hypothetical protein